MIPEVVGDSPHICILTIEVMLLHNCRSGRKTEYHISSALFNSLMKHFDFLFAGFCIHPADIITFDKIHSPGCVQLQQRVIVFLSPFFPWIYTVHIRIPIADGIGIRNLIGSKLSTLNLGTHICSPAGNPPHNMDTKFQSQSMYIFSQRTKALPALCGRKSVLVGKQSGVLVHLQLCEGNILVFLPLLPCLL